jgi:hypothetical protein
MTPHEKLSRVRQYCAEPKVSRAVLSSLLGLSWKRVDQLLPRFQTEGHDGREVLVYLRSVEKYYQSRVEKTSSLAVAKQSRSKEFLRRKQARE